MTGIGSHMYAGGGIGLGLSQVNPQLSSHPPTDLLRLGATCSSAPGSQFDHLISATHPSSFHPPPPSAFFLGAGSSGQDYSVEDVHSHQSFLQNKAFHGLMQLPDLQPNATASTGAAAANLFNLSFLSNGSSTSSNAGNQTSHHHLMMHDQYTSGNAGVTEPSNIYDPMGGGGMQALFNPSLQSESLPQMSATALLQKAAQMGATSSTNSSGGGGNGSSFLRGFGSSSSCPPTKPVAFSDHHEKHLQDIMNSFANGNSGMFTGGHQEHEAKFVDYNNAGFCNMDESSYHNNGLTRDFLGVGGVLRTMGGGMASQREQQHGVIDMGSLDSEVKPSSSSRSFASGGSLR